MIAPEKNDEGKQLSATSHPSINNCRPISSDKVLELVTESLGTFTFYKLFTKLTDIQVGSAGQVGNHRLRCPDSFQIEFYLKTKTLCRKTRLQRKRDGVKEGLTLDDIVTNAQSVADKLLHRYSTNRRAFNQIRPAIITSMFGLG